MTTPLDSEPFARISDAIRQHLQCVYASVGLYQSGAVSSLHALFDAEASANTLKERLEAIEAEVRGRTELPPVATGASAHESSSAPPPPYLRQTPSCGNRGEREPGR